MYLYVFWLLLFYKKVIEDIERAILEALDRQYADVLTPLKDNLTSKIYGLKYVQKFAKRSDTYVAPDEVTLILSLYSCTGMFLFIWEIITYILFSVRNSFKFHEKDVGCAAAKNRNTPEFVEFLHPS